MFFRGGGGYTHPRYVFVKSAQAHENTVVVLCSVAKERAKSR
jgi:hypothetical protein